MNKRCSTPPGAASASLLGQEAQDESIEAFRSFHVGHMPHTRYHHLLSLGDALVEGIRNGMTVREIPLPHDNERGHTEGVEPLHRGWGEGAERIVVEPMPSRIVTNDLGQPRGDLGVRQRRHEGWAGEPDGPRCLYPSFFGPQTDCAQERRKLWGRLPASEP